MTKPQQRLAQVGVVALAGVAVLGWVREPEKHYAPNAAQRATYQQQDVGGPPVVRELSTPVAEAAVNPVLPGAGTETRHRVMTSRPQKNPGTAEPKVSEY